MGHEHDAPCQPATRDPSGRERREYPHGSGDRNSFRPFGKDRMPLHEGGAQRHAPPGPDAQDGEGGGER